MAKCAICDKAVVDGETKTIQVCSKCLRSGKVNRA